MSLFDHFPKEKVTLVKKDGRRFDLDAIVQSKGIYTDDPNIPIEEGDEFQRILPSGVAETYIVTDAGFQQGFHGIPAHYQSKVRKTTTPVAGRVSNVYNLVGANSRVNVQSTDSSTNIVNVDASTLFTNIKQSIERGGLDDATAQRLLERVQAMETAAGRQGFGQAYKEFIAVAADHMSLFTPFLPALSQFLS